ncbi:MAG TPA: VCBS repeat-containing protein [Cyclobacteriaceae bacterium]|nr:VCBS repeat-containing protein [Cyclobacteriaceae bacterium]
MRALTKAILFFCLLTSCTEKSDTLFSKLDEDETGVNFINENHETERSNILTYEYFYNGGGVALGDINNDGLTDIYFTSNLFSNKLYLNEGNFRFRDITAQSGTACETGWKTGVTMADVNGDGLLDIYVCRSASPDKERRRNILLINNGNLTFTDKGKEYNLDDPSYSTQAAFFDFDRDSDLDVVLLNHSLLEISNVFNLSVKNSNVRFPDVGNKLYRNDGGHFTDISDSAGVYGSAFNYGLGISLSDVNNDGWIDMYTGCDYTARDKLLINDHGKFFNDVTAEELSYISKFTMGTDIADINGDQTMDIVTLDMLPEDNFRQKQLMGSDRYDVFNTMVKSGLHAQYMRNMLHLNNGNGTFSEIGQLAGISNTDWSWSVLVQDFDNDGVQDIFITNGFKRDLTNNDFAKFEAEKTIEAARKKGKQISSLDVIGKFNENKIPNYFFRGNGDLTFSNVTSAWGFNEPSISNGAAYADLDNDGDLDLVTNNMNERAGIYRNNSEKVKNSFLTLELVGKENKFGIGARVTVFADDKKFAQELLPVRGFQSSVDPTLHFGLGSITHIDSLCVRWPNGNHQTVKNIPVNQRIEIVEEKNDDDAGNDSTDAYFVQLDGLGDFSHQENEFVDFNIQSLLPRKYSTMGPALASADVNRDGLADLFVGGAKGQSAVLFLQSRGGKYIRKDQSVFDIDRTSEDVDAIFFDADQDGDPDLYVVSGGYEFDNNDVLLQDRLYKNNGSGEFAKAALPSLVSSGSCVRPSDVDGDGDIDLFVGGRLIPGRYPETPQSYVLINDGKGGFSISDISPELSKAGMVTDALWVDLNNDQREDLIVVGEWMGIEVFLNEKGLLRKATSRFIKERTEGWWNCIATADFDGDGDKDFIVGNFGLNNQIKASETRPASLWVSDFDHNGSVDPILTYYIMDKNYPYPTRDELVDQLPSFRRRFKDYASYANADLGILLNEDERKHAEMLSLEQMQSCFLRNDGDRLVLVPLPVEIQIAPVFALTVIDINGDKNPDFIAGGNLSGTRSRTGKMTGNTGFVFLGDGKGGFRFVSPREAGIRCVGDVRRIVIDNGKVIFGVNDSPAQIYESNARKLKD